MLDFGTSFYHRKFATKLCFHFAVIFVSKKRYNVNKRIARSVFADYLFSYYESQTLHLYAKSTLNFFLILLFIKVCCFLFFSFEGFSCLHEKYVFSPILLLGIIRLRGDYILSQNKPRTIFYGLSSFFLCISLVAECATWFYPYHRVYWFQKRIQGRLLYSGFSF